MSQCQVCHRETFDDDLCPDCTPPQSGPLRFYREGDGWEVYDGLDVNGCGYVYLRGAYAWFEASKDRPPMSRREVEALALFMDAREREAK